MNIVIVYNVPSEQAKHSDHLVSEEDTELSAKLVQKSLAGNHSPVTLFPISEHTVGSIKKIRADCIINLIEWSGLDLVYAKEAFAELDSLHVPYTGSPYETFYLTTEKTLMKRAFDVLSLPAPQWQVFEDGTERVHPQLRYPLIVKLALEHCGVGLSADSVVHTYGDLRKKIRAVMKEYSQPVLVEEFIEGRELQVTLLEENGTLRVLPVAEYIFNQASPVKFLTYDGRWNDASKEFLQYTVSLASLTREEKKEIESLSKHAYLALGFCDYARFDIRLNSDGVFFLETNANPGIDEDPENGLVRSFMADGKTLTDFLESIIASCMTRFSQKKEPRMSYLPALKPVLGKVL